MEERRQELVGSFWAAEDGISLLAFNGNMRIVHLERRNDMGERGCFEMTYFICSLSFYPAS
jgi:hypothetical protein